MMRFLAMGGYGNFIWSAYAISAVALIVTLALTLRAYVRTKAQLRRMKAETDILSE